MNMHANTQYPIHELIAARWSPYVYSDRPITTEELHSLFEAARWAASSYNEQPWGYLVARREDAEAFEKLLGCLVEANQAWAKEAPVLALGLYHETFTRNGKPNAHALHDLGSATANLVFEATARGMVVHQMAGILPDRAREIYGLPQDWHAATGIAIGYAGAPSEGDETLRERDAERRPRKAQQEFVFGGKFGEAASWLFA